MLMSAKCVFYGEMEEINLELSSKYTFLTSLVLYWSRINKKLSYMTTTFNTLFGEMQTVWLLRQNTVSFHVAYFVGDFLQWLLTYLASTTLVADWADKLWYVYFSYFSWKIDLTLVLLKPDTPCLCKQCRSRSVGFFRSQLIWICTVYH